MSAPWVTRLERRLVKLADTASKESIQALAKWIGFRRKHVQAFSVSLANAIADPSSLEPTHQTNTDARQWLYLQILHESILLDSGTSRWDRLSEMREILGESGMMKVAQKHCLDKEIIEKVEGLIKQWDDVNCFGGPTLITMIKKHLAATPPQSNTHQKETASTAAAAPVESKQTATNESNANHTSEQKEEETTAMSTPTKPEADESMKETDENDKTPVPTATKKETEAEPTPTPSKSPKKEVFYDFESKNIPRGQVDSKEFLAPCKAIATLQIARDLRNDNAVQVSSLLKGLPQEIKDLSEQAEQHAQQEDNNEPFLSERKARELSVKISERLLDLDINEQIQNVRTFMEIIEKQQKARKRLIYLLVQSRCQFGSREAAQEYYNLEKMQTELKKRKEMLMDAMELEGLDFEEEEGGGDSSKTKKRERELPPLTWYLEEKNNENESGEPEAKRTKADT